MTVDAVPFTYAVAFPQLANGASTQQPLVLDNDSMFDLQAVLASTDGDPITNANLIAILPNNFTGQIQLQSTGRYLSNLPLPRSLFCGTVNDFTLPEARAIRFDKKAQLVIAITNISGGNLTVTVALKGYKIFNSTPTVLS